MSTYIRSDTSEDDLLLSRCLHGCLEFGIIPGVDLAVTLDEWSVGVHLDDLGRQRPVGSCLRVRHTHREISWLGLTVLCARSQDRREVEDLSQCSMGKDVALHICGRLVTGNLEEALLVVNYQENHVILIDPFVGVLGGCKLC